MANMELITSVTVGAGGAASITLPATGTIPQTYTDLKMVYSARASVAGTQEFIKVTFNGNTSDYTLRTLQGDGSAASSNAFTQQWIGYAVGSTATASTFSSGEMYIPNYTSSNFKSFSNDNVAERNDANAQMLLAANLWSNTAAITTIQLTMQGGSNFVEGSTFYLYGISNVTSTTKATGGIVSSDGVYNYHMFPFSGTFTPTESITADYLVVAGGGGGGGTIGGGGGAGGLRSTVTQTGGNTVGVNLETPLSLTAQAYTVTIGAGGAPGTSGDPAPTAANGSDSVFASITSTGGGKGGGYKSGGADAAKNGGNGGSGGGGGATSGLKGTETANQGFAGGDSASGETVGGGGGGGAGAVGTTADAGSGLKGAGGAGVALSAFATATGTGVSDYYAGGGGAGSGATPSAVGGAGGGGAGGFNPSQAATNGTANTGGGGGGRRDFASGGAGGSGIVIIRYAI